MFKTATLICAVLGVISAVPARKAPAPDGLIPFTNCGGVFESSTGEVSSPGFPDNYPNNLNGCGYRITVPEGRAIVLLFDTIDVELEYDFVKVYDGPNAFSPELGIFSGSYGNLVIASTGNNVYITLTSDYSNSYQGFHATWTTVCGRYTASPAGSYSSPNYPAEYGNDLDECYGITVEAGQIAKVTFSDFNTEPDNDVVTVYDGASASAPVLATLSGDQSGTAVTGTGNRLFMKFNTNADVVATGFSLNWKSLCGNRRSDASGTITNSAYPEPYPNDVNECYAVDAPEGSTIQLTFTRLLTEPDLDTVSVYDGEDETAPLLGSFSGNADGAVVTSTSNVVTIIFKSDSTTVGLGFSADYVVL